MKLLFAAAGILVLGGAASAAMANNVGENYAWQFQTTADKVNQAAILDMREKKRSGYYSPPTYITNIDRQYNCSVASTATGNSGTNTNLANSPTTSGPSSNAVGNNNETDIDGWRGDSDANSDQSNSGSVGSSVRGSVSAEVGGSPNQALNSTQTNSGNQSASVDGSTACNFANVLN
ncbi:MAG: hypothetical protein EOO38_32135 [Cytophagaceae bacterium]|nr:MAG: hypothetical protein EOO38_32135 [Cytophagaceae bacterium]